MKMSQILRLYYVSEEERKGHGESLFTGLVIELEDGRFFRHYTTDVVKAFEEIIPNPISGVPVSPICGKH